jgi:hypothetical protein
LIAPPLGPDRDQLPGQLECSGRGVTGCLKPLKPLHAGGMLARQTRVDERNDCDQVVGYRRRPASKSRIAISNAARAFTAVISSHFSRANPSKSKGATSGSVRLALRRARQEIDYCCRHGTRQASLR